MNPLPGESDDPGDGVDVASFLAGRNPACPVIIHTSYSDRSLSMIDELETAGWRIARVAPIGADWIADYWQVVASELLADDVPP